MKNLGPFHGLVAGWPRNWPEKVTGTVAGRGDEGSVWDFCKLVYTRGFRNNNIPSVTRLSLTKSTPFNVFYIFFRTFSIVGFKFKYKIYI